MMCVKFHALHVGSALSCVPATTTATTMITITAAAVRRGILQVHYTNTNQRLWLTLRGRQGDRYENPIKAALNVATDDDDDDGDSPSHSLPVSLPLSYVQEKLQAHRTSHSIRTENSKETCKQNKYEIKQRLNSTSTSTYPDSTWTWTPALAGLLCLVDFSRLRFSVLRFPSKKAWVDFRVANTPGWPTKAGNNRGTWNVFGILHLSRR